jgi:hypothetical protein
MNKNLRSSKTWKRIKWKIKSYNTLFTNYNISSDEDKDKH